ncbi:hypothetical protein GCM10027161_65660 [Microbispora hainanensis]
MIEPVSTASFVIVANTVVPNSRIRRTSGSLTALTLSAPAEGLHAPAGFPDAPRDHLIDPEKLTMR